MKTEEILDLDFRKEESKEIIQKVLKKIKPLSKYSDDEQVPLKMIEKLIGKLCRKYCIMIQYISPTYLDGEVDFYSCSIKTTDDHKWLGNTYGHCMYELLAKTAIKMWTDIKKLEIAEQDWDKFREEKAKKIKEIKNGEF